MLPFNTCVAEEWVSISIESNPDNINNRFNLMKTYIFIFILVLCFTCWLGDSGMPPATQPIGIEKIPASACGVNKQESIIPDFVFNDQARSSGYIVKIDEKSSSQEADFPWGTPR